MKFKVTKKQMKENYDKIVKISYCNAQFLLRYAEPIAYSTRIEGWACDYYDIDGVLISTGYAPLEAKNTHCDYETVRRYDNMAMEIVNSNEDYETKKNKVNALLKQFIKEVTE